MTNVFNEPMHRPWANETRIATADGDENFVLIGEVEHLVHFLHMNHSYDYFVDGLHYLREINKELMQSFDIGIFKECLRSYSFPSA